jgi:Fe-S-cluster-containing dehydrogenase component
VIVRTDGRVYIDTEACIGCACCQAVCPRNALQLNEHTMIMDKCDSRKPISTSHCPFGE